MHHAPDHRRAHRAGGRAVTLLLLLLGTLDATAQIDSTGSDTTAPILYPPTIVIGHRLYDRAASGARPTAIVERERIEASGATDLADALALAPGVFIKRYGGIGGLRTISLRGTTAEQTRLLIDGVPYRGSADGGLDIGLIPASAIEAVEVIRGGDAALYGANALGGAVNVITRRDDLRRIEARASAGSFGEREIEIGGGGAFGRHRIDASLHRSEGEGDYPFTFTEFGETERLQRENGGFAGTFGRAAWSTALTDRADLGVTAIGYDVDRGVPGAVAQGSRERLRARMAERDLFVAARGSQRFAGLLLTLSAGGRLNRLLYSDPDARYAGAEGIANRYDRLDLSLNGRAHWLIDAQTTLGLTLESDHARLDGDNLDPATAGNVERSRYGGLLHIRRSIEGPPIGEMMMIEGGVRFDLFSDLDAQIAPSLGLVLQPFTAPLRLRAHGSLNYRAPTFSEQYYLNFGNAHLRTERSRSLSLGAVWSADRRLMIELSGFLIDTRDRIVAIPRSPVSWSAQNVGRVLSRGVELGVSGSAFDGLLSGQLAYTLMRADDRSGGITDRHLLPYAPQEIAGGVLTLSPWGVDLSASFEYVSHRHTLAYNTPESALPRYLVVDVGVHRSQTFGSVTLSGRIAVANLFDTEYQVVRNYPMPGRSVRVTLTGGWSDGEE